MPQRSKILSSVDYPVYLIYSEKNQLSDRMCFWMRYTSRNGFCVAHAPSIRTSVEQKFDQSVIWINWLNVRDQILTQFGFYSAVLQIYITFYQ